MRARAIELGTSATPKPSETIAIIVSHARDWCTVRG